VTALTPAQVREHARALILECRPSPSRLAIENRLWWKSPLKTDDAERRAAMAAIADAIRTARITVDWDEEHDHA